jgi:hypothetical protein
VRKQCSREQALTRLAALLSKAAQLFFAIGPFPPGCFLFLAACAASFLSANEFGGLSSHSAFVHCCRPHARGTSVMEL